MELINLLSFLQAALIARQGVTTHAGDGGGISIKDTALSGLPATVFANTVLVLYPGDFTKVQVVVVTSFDGVSELFFTPAYSGGQVPAGVPYKVLNTDFVAAAATLHGLQEQASVPVSIAADNTGEKTVLDLHVAGTHYEVRNLRLKCVTDPGAETVTVRLYELINGAPTLVDTFVFTHANYANFASLMDMFGVPDLAGDNLKVTVIASAAGPYTVTGQYAWATAT